MAQDSMRCDVNVSIRKQGEKKLGTRTEMKNINSFRFVEKAINSEIQRQQEVIEDGGSIVQETRRYDSTKDITTSMRSKEIANDYRYFPEPDLLPVKIDETYIKSIELELPELPDIKKDRFVTEYQLSTYDAGVLTSSLEIADYFEIVVKHCQDSKLAANWVTGNLLAMVNQLELDLASSPIKAEDLGCLISRIKDKTISGKIAKTVFDTLINSNLSVDEIIEQKGLKQVTDNAAIEKLVTQVIDENPDQVIQLREGKEQVLGYLVGQAMKLSQGKANPSQVSQLLKLKIQ